MVPPGYGFYLQGQAGLQIEHTQNATESLLCLVSPSFPNLNLPAAVTASVTRLSQVWPVTANLPPSPLPQTKFNLSSSFILVQESTFSVDGQIENVLGFVGHRIFVEMTQLCHYSMEAAIDHT